MTDRYAGFVVTLADDLRSDDAEHTLNALRMVRGVISVEPIITDVNTHLARAHADSEWRHKLLDMVRNHDRASQPELI